MPPLTLLTFGAARDILGAAEVTLEPPAADGPLTVAALHRHLLARFPALATIGRVRYAVNEAFAADEDLVTAADALAIIPPVSGG